MQAYNEVTCHLGEDITKTDYGPLAIHISNDGGATKSDKGQVLLVYHSDCLECTLETGCSIKVCLHYYYTQQSG